MRTIWRQLSREYSQSAEFSGKELAEPAGFLVSRPFQGHAGLLRSADRRYRRADSKSVTGGLAGAVSMG
jgi:hypothetical protein